MSIIENLYHGTSDNITEFRPFTHFGNKDAALDVIAKKIIDRNWENATLIGVNIHASKEEILELEDWGTPKSQGLASALKDISKEQDKEFFQKLMYDISLEKENGNPLWNENGFNKLKEYLNNKNISILKYKNDVEGVDRSYSFCVINSNVIEIISRESVDICDLGEKIAKAKSFNDRYKIS